MQVKMTLPRPQPTFYLTPSIPFMGGEPVPLLTPVLHAYIPY